MRGRRASPADSRPREHLLTAFLTLDVLSLGRALLRWPIFLCKLLCRCGSDVVSEPSSSSSTPNSLRVLALLKLCTSSESPPDMNWTGRNYRWAQNPQVLQLRVKATPHCPACYLPLQHSQVPADAKSKDINFDIGRTWLQIWVSSGTMQPHPRCCRSLSEGAGRAGASTTRKALRPAEGVEPEAAAVP